MAKKFLFESIFNSLKARFQKNTENVRLGLKYVESVPQLGEKFDMNTAKIKLPEECTSVIIMYPGNAIGKYRKIMDIWFNYGKIGRHDLENGVSMLDAIVTGWEEGKIVDSSSFKSLQWKMNEIQDIYMKYWRIMEEEENEYAKALKESECVDRREMKLFGPSTEVQYGAILRLIIGKWRLQPKFAESNLRNDEKLSDRLRSMCITLAKSMDSISVDQDDDDGFDRYRFEANQLLYYINWYNNLLERDINFNIIVARTGAMTIPLKVYPKRNGEWKRK